ncbi:MAG: carboxypeptidase-like regulatory domain-containing protein, partial [Bacteroidia bacterium]|nr:carboxypeptidase-like regulatory domain-containing protein [Bacteroidia bacterium]
VSVVDGNQIEGFEKKPDIISYLLLESEIRGYIEQPFYYFDTTIIGLYQALDNLLLTQGWRNFVWNNLPDEAIKFNYPAEEGFTVSGRLRREWADKPIAGANISMALLGNDKPYYKVTQTDSAGKYYFDGLDFTGPQNLLVYATDKKDKGEGLILLDSIFMEPAPVNLNQAQKSETTAKNIPSNIDVPNLIQVSNYNEISNYMKEAEQKHNILKKYHITDTIALSEVEVKARGPEKENADSETIIKVDVEGIAEPGIPLAGKTSFDVK